MYMLTRVLPIKLLQK